MVEFLCHLSLQIGYQHAGEASHAWDKRNAIQGPFPILNLRPWCRGASGACEGLLTTLSNWQIASLSGETNRDRHNYPLSFSYFTLEAMKGVRLGLSEWRRERAGVQSKLCEHYKRYPDHLGFETAH